MYNIL